MADPADGPVTDPATDAVVAEPQADSADDATADAATSTVAVSVTVAGTGTGTDTAADAATPRIELPTTLVARYRAVDREHVGSAIVDTPRHLNALTADVRAHGILVPLLLGFNEQFATLDGNHRIAVAIRLGLASVPVTLVRLPTEPRLGHARTMRTEDLAILDAAAIRAQ